jgi:hypothetical protein
LTPEPDFDEAIDAIRLAGHGRSQLVSRAIASVITSIVGAGMRDRFGVRCSVGWVLVMTLCTGRVATAQAVPVFDSTATLQQVLSMAIRPSLERTVDRLLEEGRDLTIDGQRAFNGRDLFLPGKIAIGLSHLIVDAAPGSAQRARYLDGFRAMSTLTLSDSNTTWGIYYYLAALQRLQAAGLLDRAVSPSTLATLRQRLDWRGFVRVPEYSLIDLPTNYYGVAFSVARLRFLLGWEDAAASDTLLARTVAHYRQHSGVYGFSDETNGEGRFDRYSILLIGEICQRFIETGLPVPSQLRRWLRGAVDVILVRLTASGEGFDFGRSIGPYGDTAFLEVLSAAATLGVLTPVERDMAHAYTVRALRRYATFWYDERRQTVNLWEDGRRTDAYRGKHRVLGENLSLSHQLLYTSREWIALGYGDRMPTPAYDRWRASRPPVVLTWFARGVHDRALLTVRDSDRVFSLPIINGGAGQHAHTPYFPIPFAPGVVAGVADATFPQLVPALRVRRTPGDSVRTVMPLAYQRDIRLSRRGRATTITWRQDALDAIGAVGPRPDSTARVRTTYRFTPGAVRRTDEIRTRPGGVVESVRVEFATFGTGATVDGTTIRFTSGAIREFSVSGFDVCTATPTRGDSAYSSPNGAMMTLIRCDADAAYGGGVRRLAWEFRYR